MLRTVPFHFCDILKKTGAQWERTDQWLPGAGGWEGRMVEQRGEGFQGDGAVLCPGSVCMNLGRCQNSGDRASEKCQIYWMRILK